MDILIVVVLALLGHSCGQSSWPQNQQVCGNRTVEQVYQWKAIQYALPPDYVPDQSFLQLGTFVSGVDILPNALLIMTARDASLTPATLSTVPLTPIGSNVSPVLQPYPDLAWNTMNGDNTNCSGTLISVERTYRDSCNRLWALDSGVVMSFFKPKIICPPKIAIFNLTSNQVVRVINIPSSVLTPISVLTNIRLDNMLTSNGSSNSCDDTYVYIADSPSSSLIVHKSPGDTFYKFSHPTMHPHPDNYNITVQGEVLHYFNGILGMSVGGSGSSRCMYYQAPAALTVYSIPTSALQNGPVRDASDLPVEEEFNKSSESADFIVDSTDGCLIYNPVSQGSLIAWNPKTRAQSTIATDPNVITIMENFNQASKYTVYGVSSRVQKLLNRNVNFSEVNHWVLKINLQTTF